MISSVQHSSTMTIDTDVHVHDSSPMLKFDNICVHSQRPVIIKPNDSVIHNGVISKHDINNGAIDKSKEDALSTKYRSWLSKFKQSNSLKQIPSAQRKLLIKGVSGTLSQGQVTVLTGSSGSGKSLLLRVLSGLLPMTSGDVWVTNNHNTSSITTFDNATGMRDIDSLNMNYQSIHDTPPTQWRHQVALLAQHPQLLEGSVLDNLQMPYQLHAHQHLDFDINWHITQLAHLQRSADFLQKDAYHLSGGEQQLVNTLRLLQLHPNVLLLDEPTAALDGDTSAQLVTLLIGWLRADTQRTVLWVTHDTQDIMPLADHHWHMHAGVLTQVP